MMSVKFTHLRHHSLNLQPKTKGGMTIAYEVIGFSADELVQGKAVNVYKTATARCSLNDNFCKQTGRTISSGRLKSEKQSKIYKASSVKELIDQVIQDEKF